MYKCSELSKIISHGNCFVLVGSGLSISSGYPSWTQMTHEILENLKDEIDLDLYNNLHEIDINKHDTSDILNIYDMIYNIQRALHKIFDFMK